MHRVGGPAEIRDRKVGAAGFMKENPLKDFKEGDFSDENYNLLTCTGHLLMISSW
jgi:hypothetical protein